MRLYHTSPAANDRGIWMHGIDPALSRGARKECWLHAWSRLSWAVRHVAARHQAAHVHVYAVAVPRKHLTRRQRGLWTCTDVCAPAVLVCIVTTDIFGLIESLKGKKGEQ